MKNKIKNDYLCAMKAHEKIEKDLLSVVLGEINNEEGRGKKMDDIAIQNLLRKMVKDSEIIIDNAQDESFKNAAKIERAILESYLPQLMSEEEIKRKIELILLTMTQPNMGLVMKEFNIKYKGKADNAIVSKIVKELLQ
ncbi:MAG: GatB/YqeY domain-containing protein [Candidatus Omnitrophica bacterium]|nr:GatB/YqeY domain-containing protein [Candidatus Omnitrophota bacterium]